MCSLLNSPIKKIHNLEGGCSFTKDHVEWKYFIFPQTIWRFKLNRETPLIIELENGTQIMPNYNYTTDLGSIPIPLRPIFPVGEFPIAYALHDDEYNRHGLFVKFKGETNFAFLDTKRLGADDRLRRNIRVIGGGSKLRAGSIRRAVRIGGGIPWKTGYVREGKK